MSDFEIAESTEGEVAILAPKGSLNTRTSPTLEQKLGVLLDAKTRLIVVDMKGVDYLSSPALRVLLMTMRRLKRVRGKLFVCGLREEVRKVFAITGFDRDFNIQATRRDAVALAAAESPAAPAPVAPAPEPAAAAPPAPAPEPAPAPSRPAQPAPDPRVVLAIELLSRNEDAPPWPAWTGGSASAAWRKRVRQALAK